MSVPPKKTPITKTRKRRSHLALTAPTTSICPKCRKPKFPHRMCLNCGYYNGREVVKFKSPLNRKSKKSKA